MKSAIDDMQPGEELDQLVAEKVMGYEWDDHLASRFQPSRNLEHANRVLQRLHPCRFEIDVSTTASKNVWQGKIQFTRWQEPDRKVIARFTNNFSGSLAHAICIIVLKCYEFAEFNERELTKFF